MTKKFVLEVELEDPKYCHGCPKESECDYVWGYTPEIEDGYVVRPKRCPLKEVTSD